ncbi:hypothetical protein QJS10_CPB22g00603 [Acorus calamus]|uniref:Uncharacterized protein n=1 Tax=Acorus calamus TaxID=4465 RepID=A0AAV9C165_ACOCL|nr:hypothetical protein QJS10_CPB22g00603 [Acorus calamus]
MMTLAFSSSDFVIVGHVLLLILISGVLLFLLTNFLAQTGLVTVEQQMEEMGISQKNGKEQTKTD